MPHRDQSLDSLRNAAKRKLGSSRQGVVATQGNPNVASNQSASPLRQAAKRRLGRKRQDASAYVSDRT